MSRILDTSAPASVTLSVLSFERSHLREHSDEVAAEEPMEVRVLFRGRRGEDRHSIAITMRTPGDDFELAAGFLYTEGIIDGADAIRDISYCAGVPDHARNNVVNVTLRPGTPFDPSKFSRNIYMSSSCGICGKASIDLVRTICSSPPVGNFRLEQGYFVGLERVLESAQSVFSRTGGLHASALFDRRGKLLVSREDVGRHNALDKVVGARLLEGGLPASDTVLLVSGRASYELVQKALRAGIPVLAAVGAPSSLAVEAAREFDLTLIGFLRDGRFNVYSGDERVVQ